MIQLLLIHMLMPNSMQTLYIKVEIQVGIIVLVVIKYGIKFQMMKLHGMQVMVQLLL